VPAVLPAARVVMGPLMSKPQACLISADELAGQLQHTIVVDCRFQLGHAGGGEDNYLQGHIPGAHYLHLERDLSAPVSEHGGRHPLPPPDQFMALLASLGITLDTLVVAYDDSGFAFASRFWWMARALGYQQVRVLDGGWAAWLKQGGDSSTSTAQAQAEAVPASADYRNRLDIEGVKQALARGALLADSREERRYLGLEEPLDPVAGHIPGALNFPWQGVTDEAGHALPGPQQAQRWQALEAGQEMVVYCGSGVTACVNILSLALAGREDVYLYAGSWSDWCSYM
jgi:thiosulfate/3-mercaptopyruvate sulfurtransferase